MSRDQSYEDREIIVREVGAGVGMFLAGLAVGAVVALLVAPQAGVETRREIARRAEKARKGAVRAAEGLSDSVRERFDDAKEFVEDELESARETIGARKRQVERAVSAGKSAAAQARDTLKERMADAKVAYEAGAETARASRRGVEDESLS